MSRPSNILPSELDGTPQDDVADQAFTDLGKTYTLMMSVPGKTPHVDMELRNTVQSWPHAFRVEMAVVAIVLAVVLTLGIFVDAPLKEIADPTVPENPAKAPWYFLGLQEIVSYSAFTGGLGIPVLILLALVAIPFLEREEGECGRWPGRTEVLWGVGSSIFAFLYIVGVLAFCVSFGWLRDWYPEINQLWIALVNPGTLLLATFAVYSLFVLKWTGSTRIAAVAGFCCVMLFYIVLTYFGTVHRGPNWDFYWWPSQWPGH